MNMQQLVQTIQAQQSQIDRLNQIISQNSSSTFQRKYKKALKDISGIMRANKQLKQELDQVCLKRTHNRQHETEIEIEQYRQAYERILQEKNKLKRQRQSDELELQQLRYNTGRLEQYISELKSQKMTLLREKQALQVNYSKLHAQKKNPIQKKESSIDNHAHHDKELRLLKKIQTYELRIQSLLNRNSQMQQRIKLLNSDLIRQKNSMELEISRIQFNFEQNRLALKRQSEAAIEKVKKVNNQLNAKINSLELQKQTDQFIAKTQQKIPQQEYQSQFIETLRELKIQMEPIKNQINEMVKFDQYERDEVLKEKNHLKMKVLELEAQLKVSIQNSKNLEKKISQLGEKNKNLEEQAKINKQLQEQNRLLRGKIIVLQSKEIALKNRTSQDLQNRVIEFQTRVQLLLNDSQNFAKIKNVSIHQLIALKAYIMQLDNKLKSLINENQYATKKYKSYKEKYLATLKQIKKHDSIVIAYKTKIQGYDRLIMRMQQQLDKTANIYNQQVSMSKIKYNESEAGSLEIYQKQLSMIKQKLQLQQRYSKQQIETIKLNYQTKIMEANLKTENINNLEDTIELYKSKNIELQAKLDQKENQIIQLSIMNKDKTADETSMTSRNFKNLINSLHVTINQKENSIIKLSSQLKNIEQFWKKKYSNLQQQKGFMKNDYVKRSTLEFEDKKILELQQECKRYRIKIAQLQDQLLKISISKSYLLEGKRDNPIKSNHLSIQLQLDSAKNRIRLLQASKSRLQARIKQLEQENYKIKQSVRTQKREFTHVTSQPVPQTTIKSEPIFFDEAILQQQIVRLQQKNRQLSLQLNTIKIKNTQNNLITNQMNQLISKNSELSFKIESLNFQILHLKGTNNNLSSALKKTQNRLFQLQGVLNKIESEKNISANQIKQKQLEISQLKRQLRAKQIFESNQDQINKYKIQQDRMQFKFQRQISNKSFEIDSLTSKLEMNIRKLNNTEELLLSKQKQIRDLNDQLLLFRNNSSTQAEMLKNKMYYFQDNLKNLQHQLQKSQLESTRHQNTIKELNDKIDERQNQILHMKSQLRQMDYLRGQLQQLRTKCNFKQQQILRLNASLRKFQFQIIQQKQLMIGSLKSELSANKNQFSNQNQYLEERVRTLDIQCRQLEVNYNRSHQELFQKTQIISNLQQQILLIKSQNRNLKLINEQLQEEIQQKQQKLKSNFNEISWQREQNSTLRIELEQYSIQLSTSKRQVNDLKQTLEQNFQQIQQNNLKINQLNFQNQRLKKNIQITEQEKEMQQNQIARQNTELGNLRREINDYVEKISDQDRKLINLNFTLQSLKNKHNLLEEECFAKQKSLVGVNEQLFKIGLKNKQLESDCEDKDIIINRLKNQITPLKNQIQQLNGIISIKTQEINKLNNKLFENSLQNQNQSFSKIIQLQNQVSTLKFTTKTLERELENSQSALSLMKIQINTKNQQINNENMETEKYKQEILKLKKIINEVKAQLADQKFNHSQIQSELHFFKQSEAEERRRFQEQIKSLSSQIQNLLQKLKQASQYNVTSQENFNNFKKEGFKTYEKEVQRLCKIVQDLEIQVTQLKLKMTQNLDEQNMTQQQLMIMTLTFAQIEALRNSMILKQNQIGQIRRSLIQSAKWKVQGSEFNASFIQVVDQDKNQFKFQKKVTNQQQRKQVTEQRAVFSRIQDITPQNQASFQQQLQRLRSKSMNKTEIKIGVTNRSDSTQGFVNRPLSHSQRLMDLQPNRVLNQPLPQTSSPYQSMKTSVSEAYLNMQFQQYKMVNPKPLGMQQQPVRLQQQNHQRGKIQSFYY